MRTMPWHEDEQPEIDAATLLEDENQRPRYRARPSAQDEAPPMPDPHTQDQQHEQLEQPEVAALRILEQENQRLRASLQQLQADLQQLQGVLRCAAKVLLPYIRAASR